MQSTTPAAREARLRRLARRQGYVLRKSRARNPDRLDYDGWIIVEPMRNLVVAGAIHNAFELDLDAVEEWVRA